MRAARFYGGRDIRVETVPEPEPEDHEVLVEVQATGICGSDLHGYHHQPEKPRPPATSGHELTGRVAGVGVAVRHYQIVVEPIVPCNNCPECLNGNYNLCSKLIHIGGSRGNRLGNIFSGGFAEYMVAPEDNVYELADWVSFEAGAMAEVYAVAVHALSMAPVHPGDSVAVIGSGPVGLALAQMAQVAGAASVAVLGKPDAPLQIAKESIGVLPINVGATDAVEAVNRGQTKNMTVLPSSMRTIRLTDGGRGQNLTRNCSNPCRLNARRSFAMPMSRGIWLVRNMAYYTKN